LKLTETDPELWPSWKPWLALPGKFAVAWACAILDAFYRRISVHRTLRKLVGRKTCARLHSARFSAPNALNTDSIFNPSSPDIAQLPTCGRTSLRKASNNRAPAQVVCLRVKHGASRPHSRYSWTCQPIQQCSRLLRIRPNSDGSLADTIRRTCLN
jgi:hypothetical protein